MLTSRAVGAVHRQSWFSRLAGSVLSFARAMTGTLAITGAATGAMTGLGAGVALAEDVAPADGGTEQVEDRGDAPMSFRKHALIALLANERRSIDQRLEQVLRALERAGPRDPADAVQPALARLQEELTELERRLGEITAELAGLEASPAAGPAAEDDARQAVFVPASKPRPPETSARAEIDQYSPELRRQIQEALVFFGGYDSAIDGDFGARTEAAIRRYQNDIGAAATGFLTQAQVNRLLKAAEDRRRETGLQPLIDESIGFRLVYPSALLTVETPNDGGYRLLSDADGKARLQVVAIDSRDLRTLFEDVTRLSDEGYRHMADTWFVASGEVDGEMFYSMGRSADDRSIVAHLTYPVVERERWDPFTVMLYNSFSLTGTS